MNAISKAELAKLADVFEAYETAAVRSEQELVEVDRLHERILDALEQTAA